LLDVSHAVTGRLGLTLGSVDFAAVLESAVDAVRPSASAKGVSIETVVQPGIGAITGDAGRLQQVFSNLLANGVKFTPAGGFVRLLAARREDDVVVTVSDSGAGISPAFLPHVFDRFSQEDTSTTRVHAGVGLGLSIARYLVELHGGTIAVESGGSNAGTSFTVTLPAAVAGQPAANGVSARR
jgi:signal transduction histidine kinase